ncbi:helix-turn-helix transcriptional regulator [Cryptobacterium curtum]
MQSIKHDLYDTAFAQCDMEVVQDTDSYNSEGCLYRFQNKQGFGEYWAYFRDNLFAVNVFNLHFHTAGSMCYRHTEHLCIAYYEQTDLVIQGLPSPQGSHVIGTYVADEGGEYVARFDAGAVTCATSITISPDYYRRYLLNRFGSIPDIRRMFSLVNGCRNCPALVALFKRIREYRGTGIAAELFFEGAVAEAVGLVINQAEKIDREQRRSRRTGQGANHLKASFKQRISADDARSLEETEAYIRRSPSACLDCQTLAQRACMGQTKFKEAFRSHYGCPPATFVRRIRMERASELLSDTDLPIQQIAKEVGYAKPSAFTAAFSKTTGLLPSDLRDSTY